MDRYIVQTAAQGQWERIFSILAPQLGDAMAAAGTHRPHVDCPIPGHGGRGKFRLHQDAKRDWRETGSAICTCGSWSNGFALLSDLNGWKFGETVNRVGEALGLTEGRSYEVVAIDESEAFSAEGKVLFAGFTSRNGSAYKIFTVRLQRRDSTFVQFTGSQLKKAVEAASVTVGDNCRIKFCGVQTLRGSRGDFTRKTYAVTRLPSDEEAAKAQAKAVRDTETARKRVNALWEAGVALDSGEPQAAAVRKYLGGRGLSGLGQSFVKDLRAVKGLKYRNADGAVSSWDGMIAAVRAPDGRIVSVHRTFLSDGRKAPIDRPKMLTALGPLDSIAGCAIHLGEPDHGVLCLAEGIETAASAVVGTGFPCWSCVSANGLKAVQLPKDVRLALIFEDKDASGTGQAAAEELRARLAAEGRIAVVLSIVDPLPEGYHGLDWNDMLVKGRPFPVKKP